MKAFVVDRYASKDGLRAAEMPQPELREDEVLVQVHAAGVNLLDSKIRNGGAPAARRPGRMDRSRP